MFVYQQIVDLNLQKLEFVRSPRREFIGHMSLKFKDFNDGDGWNRDRFRDTFNDEIQMVAGVARQTGCACDPLKH